MVLNVMCYIFETRCSICTVWAWECCEISAPRFLAECLYRQLNQRSSVLLHFVLFAFFTPLRYVPNVAKRSI